MPEASTSSLFDQQNPGLSPLQLYEAKVVNNKDPEHLGRIRARVQQLFDGIDDASLPWAIPTFEHVDGATSDSGILCVPKIGSKVLIHFQNGSPFHPIYRGYTVDQKTKLEEGDTNYPDRAVIRFKNGLLVVIDTSTNELFLRNPGDLHALIQGNLEVTVLGNSIMRVGGTSEHIVNGNENIRVGGNKDDIVSGSRNDLIGGSAQRFVNGTDGYYVQGNHTRVALNIYDNPSAGAPGAPSEPAQPVPYTWPGILKGGLPKALWSILHFW